MTTIGSILADISEVLNSSDFASPDSEGFKLWSILTALRGPDSEDFALKAATTAVIRHYIGLKEDNSGGAVVHSDTQAYVDYRKNTHQLDTNYRSLRHFLRHARHAFDALGLKWDEVN